MSEKELTAANRKIADLTETVSELEICAEKRLKLVEELEAQLAEANARRNAVFENMKQQAELVATLRAALGAVEAWMSSDTGPICKLWEDGDIGAYDDNPTDWEQTLFDVRDWKNGCVPTASLGYGVEWEAVTIYRAVQAALNPREKHPDCCTRDPKCYLLQGHDGDCVETVGRKPNELP